MEAHSRNKIIGSVNWNFINIATQTILNFGVGVFLARILLPRDFGLFGLTIILLGILNLLFTSSISRFVIQKKNLDEEDIGTSIWISIVLSLFAYLIVWFISPLIATFFDEIILTDLIKIYTLSIFFFSVSSILRGLLIKKLDFKSIFYSDTISLLFGYSAVSIILAINNYGVISLIYGSLAKELLSLITIYLFGRMKVSFKVKLNKIKNIVYYSGGIGLSNIFGYTANNADYVIIGKLLNSSALGLYTRAFNIMTLPLSKISMTLFEVIFSVFSNIQNDLERIKNIYLKTVKVIVLISFPILSTMIIGSELIINGIYGQKWSGAIKVLQILCFAGFFRVITNSAGAVAKATGRVYAETWRQFIYALILIIGALVGVIFGIEGVGFAVVLSSIWLYLSMSHLSLQIVKMSWLDFMKAHIPGIFVLILITMINFITLSLMNYFLSHENYILKLLILLIVSSSMTLTLWKVLPVKIIGEEGRELLSTYFEKVKSLFRKNINYDESN